MTAGQPDAATVSGKPEDVCAQKRKTNTQICEFGLNPSSHILYKASGCLPSDYVQGLRNIRNPGQHTRHFISFLQKNKGKFCK